MPEPAYIRILFEHLRNAPLEGAVTHVEIFHDDWCGVFRGAACDCEPDIATGPMIQEKYEGEDGA